MLIGNPLHDVLEPGPQFPEMLRSLDSTPDARVLNHLSFLVANRATYQRLTYVGLQHNGEPLFAICSARRYLGRSA